MRKSPYWSWIWFCLWLVTAGLAVWNWQEAKQFKKRNALAHLAPVNSWRPEQIKPAGSAGAQKVGWIVGDDRALAWPSEQGLADFLWENISRAGFTTQETVDWVNSHAARIGAPDVMLVQTGIQDILTAAIAGEPLSTTIERAKVNLSSISTVFRTNGAPCRMVMCTIIPRPLSHWYDGVAWTSEMDEALAQINQHILSLAGPNVTVVEVNAALETQRHLRESDVGSGLQLSSQGNAKVFKAVEAALKKAIE